MPNSKECLAALSVHWETPWSLLECCHDGDLSPSVMDGWHAQQTPASLLPAGLVGFLAVGISHIPVNEIWPDMTCAILKEGKKNMHGSWLSILSTSAIAVKSMWDLCGTDTKWYGSHQHGSYVIHGLGLLFHLDKGRPWVFALLFLTNNRW